jgi:hypothetical protein
MNCITCFPNKKDSMKLLSKVHSINRKLNLIIFSTTKADQYKLTRITSIIGISSIAGSLMWPSIQRIFSCLIQIFLRPSGQLSKIQLTSTKFKCTSLKWRFKFKTVREPLRYLTLRIIRNSYLSSTSRAAIALAARRQTIWFPSRKAHFI